MSPFPSLPARDKLTCIQIASYCQQPCTNEGFCRHTLQRKLASGGLSGPSKRFKHFRFPGGITGVEIVSLRMRGWVVRENGNFSKSQISFWLCPKSGKEPLWLDASPLGTGLNFRLENKCAEASYEAFPWEEIICNLWIIYLHLQSHGF